MRCGVSASTHVILNNPNNGIPKKMNLQRLSLTGWRSFGQSQEIDFSQLQPGLYYVTGTNLAEPELDGNGIGKSSLFDALYWWLKGTTSRSVRAPMLRNWENYHTGPAVVEGVLGGHTLYRSLNPNRLLLDGRPVTQHEVDLLHPRSAEAFLTCEYHAQIGNAFIDLRPTPRMELYSSVLGLDKWEERSAKAAAKHKELEQQIVEQSSTVMRMVGVIDGLERQQATADEVAWEGMQEQRAQSVKADVSTAAATVERCEILLRGARGANVSLEQEATGAYEASQAAAKQAGIVSSYANRANQLLAMPDVCPHCNQRVTQSHLKGMISLLQGELTAAQQHYLELQAVADGRQRASTSLSDNRRKTASIEADLRVAVANLQRYEQQLLQLINEVNPHTARRQQVEQQLVDKRAELAAVEKELAELRWLSAGVVYWVKGFKEIRLMQIEESLAQLNVEVNQSVYRLGLHNWEVRFEVEKETASGSIKPGFTCTVKSPTSPEGVPWEAWAGGEGQRLRLASTFGVADLIANRSGVGLNVEIYDEPSTWMTKAGIRDLLQALTDRAQQQGKIILLADHHVQDYGGFAGYIEITKGKDGSRINVR